MKKQICVTGATGSIGQKLVMRLLKKGLDVRAVVRDESKASVLKSAGAEIVIADLRKPATLTGLLEGCTMVYHTAAKLLGAEYSDFWQTNVLGTTSLVQEAVQAKVTRFVHISSVAVYGYPNKKDVKEHCPWGLDEDLYITTKQAAEKSVWSRAQDLPITIIRPGEVIGPDQAIWTTRMLRLLRLGLLHAPLNPGYLNPIYIDNLIDALILAGFDPSTVGQAFNVVDGYVLESSQYIKRLSEIANGNVLDLSPALLRLVASVLGHYQLPGEAESMITKASLDFLLRRTTFSNEKVCKGVGWTPRIDFETAMTNIAEWYEQSTY